MPDLDFPFDFDRRYALAAAPFGVRPAHCVVTLTDSELVVRYGLWTVRSALTNISAASATGPYHLLKTIGPARLTVSDRGLTFASNPQRGVQFDFATPVPGIDPSGLVKHPNLTVTVADVPGLIAAVELRSTT